MSIFSEIRDPLGSSDVNSSSNGDRLTASNGCLVHEELTGWEGWMDGMGLDEMGWSS